MSKLIGAQAQVRSLAKAVSAAFASSGLTAEDLAPRQIEHTDLPWQAPPLITNLTLAGGALQDYFDSPLAVDAYSLFEFWTSTLAHMWTSPSRIMHQGAFSGLRSAMPRVRLGARVFRFATPIGYPARLDEMAGLVFSLEAAHTALVSLPVASFLSDESNYCVTLPSGMQIGVLDGRPATASPWTYDGSGMVRELLEMPRGESSHSCLYDQIAMARSNLHEYREKFREFEAVDLALQALRCLSFGSYCPELTMQMKVAPATLAAEREKKRALADAIEVMEAQMSDRSKLQTLRSLLVPAAMTVSGFRRHIFSTPDFPFTMEAGKDQAILDYLKDCHANCKT